MNLLPNHRQSLLNATDVLLAAAQAFLLKPQTGVTSLTKKANTKF